MRQLPTLLVFTFLAACARISVPHTDAKRAEMQSCRPIGWEERRALLEQASPERFPASRYRRGSPKRIEVATDCSHFVHEIYRRAGLPYAFRSTRELKAAPEFELLPETDALPGDLMLFRGHVGLVDKAGRIISATRVRSRHQSTITRMDRASFPTFRGYRHVLRYKCVPQALSEAP